MNIWLVVLVGCVSLVASENSRCNEMRKNLINQLSSDDPALNMRIIGACKAMREQELTLFSKCLPRDKIMITQLMIDWEWWQPHLSKVISNQMNNELEEIIQMAFKRSVFPTYGVLPYSYNYVNALTFHEHYPFFMSLIERLASESTKTTTTINRALHATICEHWDQMLPARKRDRAISALESAEHYFTDDSDVFDQPWERVVDVLTAEPMIQRKWHMRVVFLFKRMGRPLMGKDAEHWTPDALPGIPVSVIEQWTSALLMSTDDVRTVFMRLLSRFSYWEHLAPNWSPATDLRPFIVRCFIARSALDQYAPDIYTMDQYDMYRAYISGLTSSIEARSKKDPTLGDCLLQYKPLREAFIERILKHRHRDHVHVPVDIVKFNDLLKFFHAPRESTPELEDEDGAEASTRVKFSNVARKRTYYDVQKEGSVAKEPVDQLVPLDGESKVDDDIATVTLFRAPYIPEDEEDLFTYEDDDIVYMDDEEQGLQFSEGPDQEPINLY